MGHYKKDGPHMESAKQERKNLLRDNPVVRDMDSSRPWMSKHFKSSMSPLKDGHSGESPMSKHDGKEFEDEGFFDSHFPSGKPKGPEMKEGMHMNYDSGINNNHSDMLGEMGKAAGEIGGKVLKDKPPVPKGNMQKFITDLGKNAAKEANEESQQSIIEEEKKENGKPLTKGGKSK